MNNTKVFVVTHKDFYFPFNSSRFFSPLTVGKFKKTGWLSDSSGENISHLNKWYCELTAIYNVYKNNKDLDYYGFCHYRRFFNFSKKDNFVHYIDEIEGDIFLKASFFSEIGNVDVVVPKPIKVNEKNLYNQYKYSQFHNIKDLDLVINFLIKNYNIEKKMIQSIMESKYLYPYNMFIMKKDIFFNYCDWLFPILDFLYLEKNKNNLNKEESRFVGFISERLFTIYFNLFIKKKFRVFYSGVTFVKNCNKLYHKQNNNDINIVICSDDKDYKFSYLLISSILENIKKNNISIFYIELNLSEKYKNNISKLERNNLKINFIDGSKYVEKKNKLYWKSYLILGIFDFMRNFDKVLYLDTKTLLIDDIKNLYDMDISNNYLAACKDLNLILKFNSKSSIPYIHCEQELKLKNKYNYFNSDVLLINIKKVLLNYKFDDLFNFLINKDFLFKEKDLINMIFQDNLLFLDYKWNFLISIQNKKDNNEINLLPNNLEHDFSKSSKKPHILNFKDAIPRCDDTNFSYFWWKIAKKTPYYYEFISTLSNEIIKEEFYRKKQTLLLKLKKFWKKIINFFFKNLRTSYKYQLNNSNLEIFKKIRYIKYLKYKKNKNHY